MRRPNPREPYKPDQTAALARIERRRRALGLSVEGLAERIDMSWRQLMRIRKDGRAWPREIRALNMALRSLEQERAKEGSLFEAPAEADREPFGE